MMTLYVILAGGSAVAALGKTLVYASALGPTDFGMISLALLVVALGAYPATFGLQDGLAREVPMRRGRGESFARVRGAALLATMVGASAVGLVVTIVGAVGAGGTIPVGAWWMGPYLTASVAFNVTQVDLQAREYSVLQAAMLLAKNACPAAIVFVLGDSWSAAQVLTLETALLVGLTVFAFALRPGEVSWNLDGGEVRRLAGIGLPFMGSSLVHNLAINLDRWAVQLVFGVAALGTYAFAMQVVAGGLVVLNVSQMYLNPRWLRAWSAEGDSTAFWARARRRLVVTGAVCAAGATAGVLAAPATIAGWWPAYEASVPLLPWAAAGAVAVAVGFFDVFFLAANAGPRLVRVHAYAAVCTAALLVVCAWADAPLVAFAIVFAVGRVLTLVLGWWGGRTVLCGVGGRA